MLEEGLQDCVKNIYPVEFEITTGERIKLFIENITIVSPQVPQTAITVKTKKIYPSECRQRASTYSGNCTVTVGWSVNGMSKAPIDKNMGDIPIMLRVCFHAMPFFQLVFLIDVFVLVERMQFEWYVAGTIGETGRARK